MTESMLSEFDYFSPQSLQVSIEEHITQEVQPRVAPTEGQSIEFDVESCDHYIDLNNSKIRIACKITKPDGTAPKAIDASDGAEIVGCVNNMLHSLFASVDLLISHKQVTETNTLYPYRAFFEELLNNNDETSKHRGRLIGFCKDTAGKADSTTLADNAGFKTRAAWTSAGKEIVLTGRLHLDMFHQPLDIPSGCSISLRLTPAKNEFVLMTAAATAYKLVITSAKMILQKKQVAPSLALAHERMLKVSNFHFPHSRVTMRKHAISQGLSTITISDVITGNMPERIIFGLVANTALKGTYKTNPFRFQHFGLTSVELMLNGKRMPAYHNELCLW
jgi:hypothetical protein